MSFLSSVKISTSVMLANVKKITIILSFIEVKIERKYTVKIQFMNDFFHQLFFSLLTISFKAQIHESSQRLWLVSRSPYMSTVIMRKVRVGINFLNHWHWKKNLWFEKIRRPPFSLLFISCTDKLIIFNFSPLHNYSILDFVFAL